MKPNNREAIWLVLLTFLELQATDRFNFRSKSTSSSVTHAVISLIIELDI